MAEIALSPVLDAGIALTRAGRWNTARTLLQAVAPTAPGERLSLAATLAEVAVDQDFAQQTAHAGHAFAVLEEALSDAPDPTTEWDLAFLRLRKDYGTALFAADRTQTSALARRIAHLRKSAPDDSRAGHAAFYTGLIADNFQELPHDAFAAYTAALDVGERTGDDLLTSFALRHLGDHAHTAGNLTLARTHWERSTELRQKTGHLLGALAQQTLLAVLAEAEGNHPAAQALTTEVNRWSHQADLPWLESQTTALLNPTTDRTA